MHQTLMQSVTARKTLKVTLLLQCTWVIFSSQKAHNFTGIFVKYNNGHVSNLVVVGDWLGIFAQVDTKGVLGTGLGDLVPVGKVCRSINYAMAKGDLAGSGLEHTVVH